MLRSRAQRNVLMGGATLLVLSACGGVAAAATQAPAAVSSHGVDIRMTTPSATPGPAVVLPTCNYRVTSVTTGGWAIAIFTHDATVGCATLRRTLNQQEASRNTVVTYADGFSPSGTPLCTKATSSPTSMRVDVYGDGGQGVFATAFCAGLTGH